MNAEALRTYCLDKPGTTEGFPFDQQTLVFKVMGKMFALTNIDDFQSINLKCDPDMAVQLREQFDGVQPGYHMNKKHWNTVLVDLVNDKQLKEWIDHSYELVVSGLPKKVHAELLKF